MSKTFLKAVRPDGTDFYSRRVAWLDADDIVVHPNPGPIHSNDPAGFLSASDALCFPGLTWPCRLARVAPVGESWTPHLESDGVVAAHAWRIVEEIDPSAVFGDNGAEVVSILDLLETANVDELHERTFDDPGPQGAVFARDAAAAAALSMLSRRRLPRTDRHRLFGAARSQIFALIV